MTKEQVQTALTVLDLRERLVFLFAVLVGRRPGEIFALRWKNVGPQMVSVMERVYRGLPDTPKTERGVLDAAVPPDMAADIQRWREISLDTSPEALVFPSERGTFMSRDNFLRRNIRGKLKEIKPGWVTFQVLRRTQASLGHQEGIDPMRTSGATQSASRWTPTPRPMLRLAWKRSANSNRRSCRNRRFRSLRNQAATESSYQGKRGN